MVRDFVKSSTALYQEYDEEFAIAGFGEVGDGTTRVDPGGLDEDIGVIGDDDELQPTVVYFVLEDFTQVIRFTFCANRAAHGVSMVQQRADNPDGDETIRAGDEYLCRTFNRWHL